MKLYKINILRKLLLPVFRKINLGDIKVNHAWTNHKVLLHSFNHKGYWFKSINREHESMLLYKELISPGDIVIEVGGHIGFITLLYSDLVGKDGFVYVLEPGINNIKYIKENISQASNIQLFEQAANDSTGTVSFYIENLTGQNNSLNKNYSVLKDNIKSQNINDVEMEEVKVSSITLFDLVKTIGKHPDFFKIDVESAELNVLKGMRSLLDENNILMVEVVENQKEVFDMLVEHGYCLFSPRKVRISNYNELCYGDNFAIKKSHHLFDKVFT